MSEAGAKEAACALAQIPCGSFILTAAYEDSAAGVLVHWVQRCSLEPPMVAVALDRGHIIEPLIRDSRAFALCQIASGDQFLCRKFACETDAPPPNNGRQRELENPFISVPVRPAGNGSPIIERALCYIECELARNIDIEGDHRLYVGRVLGGGMLSRDKPAIHFGDNGSAP